MQPLILTLKFDSASFEYLNGLRQQHFPRERNFLSAHLTLFHALPAEKEAVMRADLKEICTRTPFLPLRFSNLRFLGKGVAIEVEAPLLVALRRELSKRWGEFLGPQDSQTIRPHVTIQNKVTPQAARELFDQLSPDWQPFEGRGEACLLWRYRGGPWDAEGEGEFTFGNP